MPSANEVQHDGSHYRNRDSNYQHWDLVADTGMGYFEAQITRYIARWRFKEGALDVEKALHYAQKMSELIKEGRYPTRQVPQREDAMVLLEAFAIKQKLTREETLIFELCAMRATEGDVDRLLFRITALLSEARKETPRRD